MKRLLPLLLLLFVSPACSAVSQAIAPEETIVLFNGQDLSSFYTWLVDTHREDPDQVFTVVDQVDGAPAIRISGERWGGIVTRETFRDYHLVTEFRWGLTTWGERRDKTRDSGILIHCQGPDGNTSEGASGPWMRSVEAQIIEGGVGDFILVGGHDEAGVRLVPRLTAPVTNDRDDEAVYDPQGESRDFEGGRINWWGRDPAWKDDLGFRGPRDVESPLGEWTRLDVIADGDRITILVNGYVVNAGTRSSAPVRRRDAGRMDPQEEDGRGLPGPGRQDRSAARRWRQPPDGEGVRGLHASIRLPPLRGVQQRAGDSSAPGRPGHRLRGHRAPDHRQHRREVRGPQALAEARLAVPRLPRPDRASEAGRRMEPPGGDRPGHPGEGDPQRRHHPGRGHRRRDRCRASREAPRSAASLRPHRLPRPQRTGGVPEHPYPGALSDALSSAPADL